MVSKSRLISGLVIVCERGKEASENNRVALSGTSLGPTVVTSTQHTMSKTALASWTTLKKVTSQERAGLCLIFFLIDPQGPRVSCTAEYDVANPPNPKLKLDFVQHAETILSSRGVF